MSSTSIKYDMVKYIIIFNLNPFMAEMKKDYNKYPFKNLSLQDMKGERWKDMPSFDGYYLVSNYGRIWALPRPIHSTSGQHYFIKEHIKKQYILKYFNKYVQQYTEQLNVHLRYEGKDYNFKISRLVYDLFVKRLRNFKDDHLLVVHKDGDNCNNRYDNLVLMNGSQLYRHGLQLERRPRSSRIIKKGNPVVWSDKNSPRPVIQYSLAGKKLNEYESIRQASDANKVHRTSVRHVVMKRLKQLNGFVYRFKDDPYKGEHADFSYEKSVTQYSVEGRKITVFKSVKQASIQTGIDSNTISRCALHKVRIAGGFVWRYQGEKYNGEYTGKIKNKAKPIIQYTLEGKKIASFLSVNEASIKTGFNTSTLLDCAYKRTKVSHGFVWRFKGDNYKGEYKNYRIGKPVTQFTTQGKKVRSYPTIAAAALATGLTSDNIQKTLHGENKTAGGFNWKFATQKEIGTIDLKRVIQYYQPRNNPEKGVIRYSLDGKKALHYPSLTKAAKACKISATNISFVLNKNGRTAGGYVWRTKGRIYNGSLARMPLPNKARTVTQYDRTGKKLKVFKSGKEAEKITGISSSTISSVANGKLKTTGGYIWKYGDGPKKIDTKKYFASTLEKLRKLSKPVIQFTLEGSKINEYPSIAAAARTEGISVNRISSVINNTSLSAGGYLWKLKPEIG